MPALRYPAASPRRAAAVADLRVLLRRERRGGRLLEDLLVATLDACSRGRRPARPSPCASAMIWTSMWRAPPTSFSTNTVSSPNAPAASDARRREGLVDARRRSSTRPDAAAAAAGGGLDHDRDSRGGRPAPGLPRRWRPGRRSTPPPGRRTTRPAAWSVILSPRRRMVVGVGPDEDDAELGAQCRRSRRARRRTPSRPRRRRPRRPAAPRSSRRVVEVADPALAGVVDVGGRAQVEGLVGLADEHRPAVGLGVQRDRAQVRVRARPLYSRTALMSRMAGSPRLTMAMRSNSVAVVHQLRRAHRRRGAAPARRRRVLPGSWMVR